MKEKHGEQESVPDTDEVKQFYKQHHDKISTKRHNSPYWIRRYAHREIHRQFLAHLQPGQRTLDVGCGEGNLSCLAAHHGCDVVGLDMSEMNVVAAKQLAADSNVTVQFMQGDAENVPFADNTFDVVVSSHVLEHLPDLKAGLHELHRVTKSVALIAMPTALAPAAWALLGKDAYWRIRKRSLVAIPVGMAKTLQALFAGQEGPDEGYGGNESVPHVWRFPWVMRRQIEEAGFDIQRFEAGPLLIPYVAQYWRPARKIQHWLDKYRDRKIMRNLGFGSFAVCIKK